MRAQRRGQAGTQVAIWMLVAALGMGLVPRPALAARSSSEQAALMREGERLYSEGRYLEAAQLLEAANDFAPEPRLVYNIARAYDQAGELRRALASYRYYLALSGTDPMLSKRSQLSVDRLVTLIDREDTQLTERSELRAEQEEESARVARESEQRRAQSEEDRDRTDFVSSKARYGLQRSSAIAFAALAVGGLTVGTVYGFKARGTRSDFETAATSADKAALARRTRRESLIADVSFGAAVASAVAAILLYPRGPAPAGTAYLAPSPSGLGAGVGVAF